MERLRARVNQLGPESVHDFTGSPCEFPLQPEDLAVEARESIGPALFGPRLRHLALKHMGGREDDEAAVLNRMSGGIIATEVALCSEGDTIISVVPGAISHPSIRRGAAIARATLVEVSTLDELEKALAETSGPLVIVTGVTSELIVMPEETFLEALRMTKRAGRTAFVDDAYGARIRTVLCGQPEARRAGADLAITSNHKAGLLGPRAGLLVGEAALVRVVLSKAMELGQEGRAPLALGVLRSLERYGPEHLQSEAAVGQSLHAALADRLGHDRVTATELGPLIEQDEILTIARERAQAGSARPVVVPAEAGAALGMLLLEHHGMLTVNAMANPGGRVSLRLKAPEEEVHGMGGVGAAVAAVDDAFDRLSRVVQDVAAMRRLILGDTDPGDPAVPDAGRR
jgi:L-seryl-tRNA(Ser) seleniumtransferase